MTLPLRIPKAGTIIERARAATRPPAISLADASAIVGEAGLGRLLHLRNLPNGWRNRVGLAITSRGRFILRGYPPRWTDEAVVHEHSIMEELERRSFAAPRLVRGPSGATRIEVGSGRYAVLSYEQGRSLTGYHLRRSALRSIQWRAGRLLGEYHRVLAGFTPAGRHHLGLDPATGQAARDVAWHRRTLRELHGRDSLPSIFPSEKDAGPWEDRLAGLDDAIAGAALPVTVIHGDFGLHNILFAQDGTAVVHDFELARLDYRAVDLVTALSRFRSDEFVPAFVSGLEAADGLEEREWEMLPLLWEWYRIRGAIQSWEAFARFGGEHRLDAARRRLEEAVAVRQGAKGVLQT